MTSSSKSQASGAELLPPGGSSEWHTPFSGFRKQLLPGACRSWGIGEEGKVAGTSQHLLKSLFWKWNTVPSIHLPLANGAPKCKLPGVAVTNYHKLRGLQQEFAPSLEMRYGLAELPLEVLRAETSGFFQLLVWP